MNIALNREEVRTLRIWASNSIAGGHWGDGNVVLGEEKSVIDKINSSQDGNFDFNSLESRVLLYWMEDNQKQSSNEAAITLTRKIEELTESNLVE
jgi:hypothetical protein